MKKLIFITLLAALVIGIMAQTVPFGLDFGLSKKTVESKLKEQGFKVKSKIEDTMVFENPKIEYLKEVSVEFDDDNEVESWDIDYIAKDPDAFFNVLKETLENKHGEIYDYDDDTPIWKLDNDEGAYLYRLRRGDVNVRIRYDVYYDPYEFWW